MASIEKPRLLPALRTDSSEVERNAIPWIEAERGEDRAEILLAAQRIEQLAQMAVAIGTGSTS